MSEVLKVEDVPATGLLMSPAGSMRYKMGMGTACARSASPSSKPVSYYSTYAQRKREQAYPTPATSTSSNCPSPTPKPGSKRNVAVSYECFVFAFTCRRLCLGILPTPTPLPLLTFPPPRPPPAPPTTLLYFLPPSPPPLQGTTKTRPAYPNIGPTEVLQTVIVPLKAYREFCSKYVDWGWLCVS